MKIFFFIILIFFSSEIYSKQENPYSFIENIIEKTKPCIVNNENECLEKLMEMYLDINEVSVWISGKNIWLNSSEKIKLEFSKEIKKLILKTYIRTINYYIDSDVEFIKNKNDDSEYNKTQKRIQVLSIMKKNGKNVYITYRLVKNNDSWLVFDVIIEGISILRSLQTQYSGLIKEKGLENVIQKIKIANE